MVAAVATASTAILALAAVAALAGFCQEPPPKERVLLLPPLAVAVAAHHRAVVKAATAATLPSLACQPLVVAAVVVGTPTAVLVALAGAVEQVTTLGQLPFIGLGALQLPAKATLVAAAQTPKVTLSETAVAVVVQAALDQTLSETLAVVGPVVLVLVMQSEQDQLNTMAAVAAAVLSTQPVPLAALVAAATEQVLQVRMPEQELQTLAAVAVVEHHWMSLQQPQAAPASSSCATASDNFSTGECNETDRNRCSTGTDRMRN